MSTLGHHSQLLSRSNRSLHNQQPSLSNFIPRSHYHTCCKRSTFSIMSFSRISKLRSVESCPDVSLRCNDCSLRQSPISFAHKAFWCKIRSQKLANSACVNSSRRISAQSESNLTPDCLRSLVRFPQIFQSFTLTKLDRLSTVDLHSRLYRTSNKLSSG